MRRLVAAGAVALLASVPAAAAAPANGDQDRHHNEQQIPFTQTQHAPATTPQQNQTEAKVVADVPRCPEGQGLGRALPEEEPGHPGDLRRPVRGLGREGVVGAGGRDRDRPGRRHHRHRHRGLDGAAGGVAHGAGRPGRVRRQEDQQPRGLARLLRRLPDRPRRPSPAAQPPQPRPARAAVVLRLALVLQPRPDLHQRAARLPGSRLPARTHALDRHPRPAAAHLSPALAGVAARRGDRLHVRLQGRAERRATRT